jgi:mRNA-degrading endonuclease RelE of RelBE toxin-antitoxin system
MLGNKLYNIEYAATVIKYDIPALPVIIKGRIKRAIEERLMVDPLAFGKPLQYNLKGYRRLRVGDYRVIYRIEHVTRVVFVVAIKHRKEAYVDSACA